MTDPQLQRLHSIYSNGLYFKDLTKEADISSADWSTIVSANDPVAMKLLPGQLQGALVALVNHGLGPSTPCALISEELLRGTIGDIGMRAKKIGAAGPAYLVIAERLDLLMNAIAGSRRLSGVSVLVTRASSQAGSLVALLEREGATILQAPAIDIVLRPAGMKELESALQNIESYSYLLLTSANSVDVVNHVLKQMDGDWSLLKPLQIGCIGPATADAVRSSGGTVAFVPLKYQGESLAEEIVKQGVSGKRILLPRAAGSRKVLIELLTVAGAEVHEIQIYQARLPQAGSETMREIFRQPVDFVTFTSSSTVHNFMEMAKQILLQIDFTRTRAACIGPITASTLREYGIEPAVEARDFTIPGLVHALIEAVHSPK